MLHPVGNFVPSYCTTVLLYLHSAMTAVEGIAELYRYPEKADFLELGASSVLV